MAVLHPQLQLATTLTYAMRKAAERNPLCWVDGSISRAKLGLIRLRKVICHEKSGRKQLSVLG